jgi:hypothetical protein
MDDAEYIALMGTPPPAPIPPKLAARSVTDAVDLMTVALQALDDNARPTSGWRALSDRTISDFHIDPPRPRPSDHNPRLERLLNDPDLDRLPQEEEYIERATRTTPRGLFGR